MEEQLVSFETAKLAKEKGFLLKQSKGYYKHGTDADYVALLLWCESEPQEPEFGYAPAQSILAQWILEKHNMFVSIELAYNVWGRYSANVEKLSKNGLTAIVVADGFTIFNDPFSAWEEGLYEALKHIKL